MFLDCFKSISEGLGTMPWDPVTVGALEEAPGCWLQIVSAQRRPLWPDGDLTDARIFFLYLSFHKSK